MIGAALRSALYLLLQIIITPPYALITLVCFPLSPHDRYRVTSSWTFIMLFLLRHLCGIRYQILGAENIPKTPSIVLSKHQSAWETLAFQQIFPPQVWVLKKELLLIPFFGWGLAMTVLKKNFLPIRRFSKIWRRRLMLWLDRHDRSSFTVSALSVAADHHYTALCIDHAGLLSVIAA